MCRSQFPFTYFGRFLQFTVFSDCCCPQNIDFDTFGGVDKTLGFDVVPRSLPPWSEVVRNGMRAIVLASACGEVIVGGQACEADR